MRILRTDAASLQLALEFDQPFQRFREVFECRCRKHDRVAPSAHVFGDFEEAAALIFFQIEEENLSLVPSTLIGSVGFTRTSALAGELEWCDQLARLLGSEETIPQV